MKETLKKWGFDPRLTGKSYKIISDKGENFLSVLNRMFWETFKDFL